MSNNLRNATRLQALGENREKFLDPTNLIEKRFLLHTRSGEQLNTDYMKCIINIQNFPQQYSTSYPEVKKVC